MVKYENQLNKNSKKRNIFKHNSTTVWPVIHPFASFFSILFFIIILLMIFFFHFECRNLLYITFLCNVSHFMKWIFHLVSSVRTLWLRIKFHWKIWHGGVMSSLLNGCRQAACQSSCNERWTEWVSHTYQFICRFSASKDLKHDCSWRKPDIWFIELDCFYLYFCERVLWLNWRHKLSWAHPAVPVISLTFFTKRSLSYGI